MLSIQGITPVMAADASSEVMSEGATQEETAQDQYVVPDDGADTGETAEETAAVIDETEGYVESAGETESAAEDADSGISEEEMIEESDADNDISSENENIAEDVSEEKEPVQDGDTEYEDEEDPPAENTDETTEETEEEPQEEYADLEVQEEDVYIDGEDIDLPSEEEMIAGYVDSVMLPEEELTGFRRKTYGITASEKLNGFNLAVYEALNREISLVAAGERSSTVFAVAISDLGLEKTEWTAEELGVDSIIVNGSIPSNVISKVKKEVGYDFGLVIDALLADDPYSLYWFDKTGSIRSGGYSYRTGRNAGGETVLMLSGSITVYFPVAGEYALSDYEVDTSYGQSIQTARENAVSIISSCEGMSDHEKLKAYEENICKMTSYNYDALGGNVEYGNPWQLIWVFDGDESTKVVCEGYAKAFKYLCDLSSFRSGDISCILVVGDMNSDGSGGGHMWNVVRMDDKNNWLVDVTNCDSGTVGYPDALFLKGPAEGDTDGDPHSGYTIQASYGRTINYSYDTEMFDIFDEEDLTLTNGKYEPGAAVITLAKENIKLDEIEYTYNGKPQSPDISVFANGTQLSVDEDYLVTLPEDIVNAGQKTITISGTGKYDGTVEVRYDILPADISGAEAAPEQAEYEETGEEIKPSVSITVNGSVLEEGKDYDLSYDSNIQPGTAQILVKGKGNYTGEKTLSFEILKAPEKNSFRIRLEDEEGGKAKGAVYGIYYDEECADEAGRAVIDSDGAVDAGEFLLGRYYIREISAPEGYGLNDRVYTTESLEYVEDGFRIVSVCEVPVPAGRFVQEGKNTYYYDKDGNLCTGLMEIEDFTYYFGPDGAMLTKNWKTLDGSTYFFGADGRALEGMCVLSGKEFFFDSKGVRRLGLVTDENGDRYYLYTFGTAKNEWVITGNRFCYFGGDGKAATGSAEIDGKTYQFDDEGFLKEGIAVIGEDIYHADQDGRLTRNAFRTVDGHTYFFGTDRRAYKDLKHISGKPFFFDENGWRKLGLVSDGENMYFMTASGMEKEAWKTVAGKQYYFCEDGLAARGLKTVDEDIYYFGDNCAMVRNRWMTVDGAIYFFGSDGKAYKGNRTINNKQFVFSDEGKMLRAGKS